MVQTAIAASVGLRCYGLTSPRQDGKVSVHLHDIGNFYYEWDVESLPWDASIPLSIGEVHPENLDSKLVDALTNGPLAQLTDDVSNAKAASLAFLYLYMSLAVEGSRYAVRFVSILVLKHISRPAINFTARSTLPVGAGLGSSASFSSCAAIALLLVYKRVRVPSLPAPSTEAGHIHVSHQGRRAITPDIAEEVNRWAFVAEKILHGNPSGVDNSVAVFGGALAYTRPGFNRKSGMEIIQGYVPGPLLEDLTSSSSFKSLRFLLTNTKIPRDTKKLVAGVGQKKIEVG